MNTLLFNLLLCAADAACLAWLRRRKSAASLVLCGLALAAVAACTALVLSLGRSRFFLVALVTWALFLHGWIYLVGAGLLLRRSRRALSAACLGAAAALAGVCYWAFRVEPLRLEVTVHEVAAPGLPVRELRIAVIADLQTDRIGELEARALRAALEAEPDLILLPGDYVQAGPLRYPELAAELSELFVASGLSAPLGVFAVRGNVDPHQGWKSVFEGSPVVTMPATATRELAPGLFLTGLSLGDSFDVELCIEPRDGYHIAFGHGPDFALGAVEADLLVAGHTHGGQVRLPLLGPPITLSRIPRAWAAGRTELSGERTLIVSRGVGMERNEAPRLRFLCRPEVVLIDLVRTVEKVDASRDRD